MIAPTMMPRISPMKICWVSVRPRRGVDGGMACDIRRRVLPGGAGLSGFYPNSGRVSGIPLGLHPQGTRRQLARLEARGTRELLLALREVDSEPPLVGPTAAHCESS